jgi:hypothetical protein
VADAACSSDEVHAPRGMSAGDASGSGSSAPACPSASNAPLVKGEDPVKAAAATDGCGGGPADEHDDDGDPAECATCSHLRAQLQDALSQLRGIGAIVAGGQSRLLALGAVLAGGSMVV